MHRILAVSMAGLLLLGACGDDDDDDGAKKDDDTSSSDDDKQAYVDALAAEMTDSEDGVSFDDETADCVAEVMIDAIGVDNIKDAGVSAEELADADDLASLDIEIPTGATSEVASGLKDCDAVDVAKDALAQQAGSSLSEEDQTCLSDAMADDAVAEAMGKAIIEGDSNAGQSLFTGALQDCPNAASQLLLAEMGADLSPEAQACVQNYVQQNAQAVAEAFGSDDESTFTELGTNIATACPEIAASLGTNG